MDPDEPRGEGWTRRSILLSWPLFRARKDSGKGRRFPSERFRYPDPGTEFPVYRLTSPAHSSWLPAWYARAISRRSSFLLFWSDRGEGAQAFRLDLHGGGFQQLTAARSLDGASIRLAPDDRSFYHFDGPSLREAKLSNLKEKEVYRVPDGWTRSEFSLSPDGSDALLVESRGGQARLLLLRLPHGGASTVLETNGRLTQPLARPRREEILYRQEDSLWVVGYDGRQRRKLPLAPGRLGVAFWSPDGRTVLYLNIPEDPRRPSAIRECDPDAKTEQLVCATSQYADFAANGDASVFVGASRNRGSPDILLLLRSVRRELTLCEHAASDPAGVNPVFSPDSQQVCFQSDRHGKPAIYWVAVDRLVERTAT